MLNPSSHVATTLIALLLITGPAAAQRPSAGCNKKSIEQGRRIERRVEVGGSEREFILDVPKSLHPREPVPLMFDFHGFGHSGPGVWRVSKFRDLAEAEKFITVYPTGLPITLTIRKKSHTGPGWRMEPDPDNRDLAFTKAMLDELLANYCIDQDRIYSTGFSNGAFFSSLLGCQMADVFAAIAPVAGGPYRGECKPSQPVAALIHHGTLDHLIPASMAHTSRDQWLDANGCRAGDSTDHDGNTCQRYAGCRPGGAVIYCEEEFPHLWPPQATGRIWSFFAGTSRSVGQKRDPR